MILVVSAEKDLHAREVMARLDAKGASALLLDLSTFPIQSMLTIDFMGQESCTGIQLSDGARTQKFADCHVVWWRRPQPFTLPAEIDEADSHHFAVTECYSAFSGLWLTLDAFWINHPTRDEEAARKVYQLKVAKEIGLPIPETRITNSPERALKFIEKRGPEGTVYKAFSATEQAWRETRLLKPEEVALLNNVRYAPVIFQEYVPAHADLRITIVGERVFPAAIYSQETDYKVDFRMSMNTARVEAVELPSALTELLLAYMQRLGLVYGAIDMRLTPDGEYVFLEINPSGQWLFVEQRTGQQITDAMADLMAYQDRALGNGE